METDMTGRIPARAVRLAAAMLAAIGVLAVGAGTASASEVIYNNIPSPFPGNVPSVSFEATSTSQFGGEVELTKPWPKGVHVTVAMSSWACQSGSWTGTPECKSAMGAKFTWPITLSVYEVGPGNTVGPLIKSLTKEFSMPYRPSQNNKLCVNNAGKGEENYGGWYDSKAKECLAGRLFKVQFMLDKVAVPQKVIITVAYNTSDYGAEPQRSKETCATELGGCPHDSLNVGLNAIYSLNAKKEYEAQPTSPSVGAYALPAEVFVNSALSAMYCGNAAATKAFGPSGPCWTYEQPAFEVRTG